MIKKLLYGLAGFALSFSFLSAEASETPATLDSEGYPYVYLRGDFNNTGWSATDAYKFTRSGDTYTLVINNRNAIGNCQFKIADDQWDKCNLGADLDINASQYASLKYDSQSNLRTNGWNDAVISFTYKEGKDAQVKFIINGVQIDTPDPEPEPEPSPVPDVYLRGDFNNTGWNASEAYRFKYNNGFYTLNVTSSNPITGGSSFKIGSADWKDFDLGGESQNITIDNTQTLTLTKGGANLTTTKTITDGSISFSYTGDYPDSAIVKFVIAGTEEQPLPPVTGLSGTLPVLYINVYTDGDHTNYNNEIISKDLSHKNYFEFAEYWLDTNGCEWLEALGAENVGSSEKPLALQIKARGNWTMKGFSKKPFKLKLDKKQSLLGLSKSKHFAILAHADDNKGYLRNFTGFNLGKRIGLPWTPSQQPVEVVINGNYRGLYFLTESIRVDEDRVNIAELDDNVSDSSLISGGYIVELDNYDEDSSAQIQMKENTYAKGHFEDKLRITFDTPEVYSDLQRRFITDQFTAMNEYVGSNNDKLWSYLDLDDAARYYLVEEIVSHTESYHGSTYLFRDRNMDENDSQKWHFSPLWDFGNAFNGNTYDFFYNCDPFGNTWIPSIRENKKFNDKVKATWLWFMSNEYDGLFNDIDEYVSHLTKAAQADYNRWNGQPIPAGGQGVADNRDMTGKAREVKNHLNDKINWLKNQFGNFAVGSYSEPERDTTPAAELPSYVTTGIDSITEADSETMDNAEFYTLQGFRVANPTSGNIYIMRRGTKSTKIMVR